MPTGTSLTDVYLLLVPLWPKILLHYFSVLQVPEVFLISLGLSLVFLDLFCLRNRDDDVIPYQEQKLTFLGKTRKNNTIMC